jgi:hypothetical protein
MLYLLLCIKYAIVILYMELFAGIGGDSNWFLNRNIKNVPLNKLINNVCSGLIKNGNRVIAIDKKSGECDYYAYKKVSFGYKNGNDYFVKYNNDNPIVYKGDDQFICTKKGDFFDNIFKTKDIDQVSLSDEQIDWINKKVELSQYLGIKSDKVNNLLTCGIDVNDIELSDEMYFNGTVNTVNPFVFLGVSKAINEEYKIVNGSLMENDWFCNTGIICELNANIIFKCLSYLNPAFEDLSINHYSNPIGDPKKYSSSLVNITLFVKFKNIWVLVSLDLMEIFRQFVDFVRELSIDVEKKTVTLDVKIMSIEYWKRAFSELRKYTKVVFMILRSFSIGYEVCNELFSMLAKVNLDISSCSLGVSGYLTMS